MKVKKIFNNNAVSTILDNNQEVIVIGVGLGFNKKSGDSIDQTKIEKIFHVQTDLQSKFLNMIENVTPSMLESSERIIELSKTFGKPINSQGILSLLDHIQFAVERYEQNINLPNLMLSEIKMLYPKEYEMGLRSLEIVNQCCNTKLPIDEAGYIALHFVNVAAKKEDTYDVLKFINGTLKLINDIYDVLIDDENLDILRLSLHLKLLAQRIILNTESPDLKMTEMFDYLISKDQRHTTFLEKFRAYMKDSFDYQINKQEEVYLLVHLTKIL